MQGGWEQQLVRTQCYLSQCRGLPEGLTPTFPPLQPVGRRSRTARATSPRLSSPTDTLPTCTVSGGSPSPPERRYRPPAGHRGDPIFSQPSSPSLPHLRPFFFLGCPKPQHLPAWCLAAIWDAARHHHGASPGANRDPWHPLRPSATLRQTETLWGMGWGVGGAHPTLFPSPPALLPNFRSS